MGRESRIVSVDVDTIIAELGHGKFHVVSFFFIAVAIFFNSITGAIFIFTARDTEYRCYVPQCDSAESVFRPPWLSQTVPHLDKIPSKCEYFVRVNASGGETIGARDACPVETYQNHSTQQCDKWVYGDGETIVREFNIPCQEWKRTLVGTVNSIGQFVCLSFSGLISDTIGRRSVMIYATVLSGIIGVAQSYANDYWTFLFFEFLVNAVGSGAYSASFVLGIEIMIPEKRVFGSTIMNLVCAVATISLGVAAWLVPNWRHLLRVTYLPSLIMVLSLWAFPESIRWLLVKGKRSEASHIIKKAAKMNNVTLSEKVSKYLEHISAENVLRDADKASSVGSPKINKKLPLKSVLKSRPLIMRLVICACCWMTNAFVYYGLSLNAVSIMGSENNPYLNFILVSLVELPAQGIVVFMLDTAGRRLCLCSSLIGSALSCFAFILIPSGQQQVSLIAYLLGKLFITVSFNVVYIYTAELFPTSLRHSILACCSMLGRFGSMLAPQTPLLEIYLRELPMILFGMTAVLSGLSILTFPETLNIKLPDTIEEAENIGTANLKSRTFAEKYRQVEEENLNEVTSDNI